MSSIRLLIGGLVDLMTFQVSGVASIRLIVRQDD